ncbi:MAG: DMT family transporter [Clostridiaceae bacterium]|nr:DMT family transporter [Clostridiaceae bacterium]
MGKIAQKSNKSGFQLRQDASKAEFWQKPVVWLTCTFICIFLWGTAFPAVKTGYDLFQIDQSVDNSIASLLLFAGMRFSLAGLLTIVFTVVSEKRNPLPQNSRQIRAVLILAIPQTILQYGFFFVGLANTSGTIGSILASTSSFIAVILASFFFKDEKLTNYVVLGCVVGFAGVVTIDFQAGDNLGFSMIGDGMMLLSSVASAIATNLSKKLTEFSHPRLLSGWNFLVGGIVLMSVGKGFNGEVRPINISAWLILLYLAFLSATAFSLWTTMLKYHEVAKLSVFKSLIPVVGAVGSALILKENILQPRIIIALILVVLGIFLVNYKKPSAGGER